MYNWILRWVCFLRFSDLRPPYFAKLHFLFWSLLPFVGISPSLTDHAMSGGHSGNTSILTATGCKYLRMSHLTTYLKTNTNVDILALLSWPIFQEADELLSFSLMMRILLILRKDYARGKMSLHPKSSQFHILCRCLISRLIKWSNRQEIIRLVIREEVACNKVVLNFGWGWGETLISSLGLHLRNNITWFGPIGLTSCDGDVQTRALNRPLGVSINKQQALVMKWFWARQCGINWGLKYSLFRDDDTRDGWGSLFPGAHDKKKILIHPCLHDEL